MLSEAELLDGIDQLCQGKHTIQNCEKLAAVFTVLDHLYPVNDEHIMRGYSGQASNAGANIDIYGDTEFMQAIQGKEVVDVLKIIDELMSTLNLINHRLYLSVLRKLGTE